MRVGTELVCLILRSNVTRVKISYGLLVLIDNRMLQNPDVSENDSFKMTPWFIFNIIAQ